LSALAHLGSLGSGTRGANRRLKVPASQSGIVEVKGPIPVEIGYEVGDSFLHGLNPPTRPVLPKPSLLIGTARKVSLVEKHYLGIEIQQVSSLTVAWEGRPWGLLIVLKPCPHGFQVGPLHKQGINASGSAEAVATSIGLSRADDNSHRGIAHRYVSWGFKCAYVDILPDRCLISKLWRL
jgi:hypothetical protein